MGRVNFKITSTFEKLIGYKFNETHQEPTNKINNRPMISASEVWIIPVLLELFIFISHGKKSMVNLDYFKLIMIHNEWR